MGIDGLRDKIISGGGLDAAEIADIRQQIGTMPHAGAAIGALREELATGDYSPDTRQALNDLIAFAEARNKGQTESSGGLLKGIDHANPFAWIGGALGLRPYPHKL